MSYSSLSKKPTLILALLLMFFASTSCSSLPEPQDIFINGVIWTGNPDMPRAEAFAVLASEITSVGKNEEIQALAGSETVVHDLGGKFVTPGFIDNHEHFLPGGFQLGSVDLRSADSPAEFTRRIAAFVHKRNASEWVLGGDWDHEAWGGMLPDKKWIDGITPQTPVFVNRLDGHMALANSKTLRLSGITKDTPDPPGGTIVRDPATGEPTGVLKDEAMNLVYAVMPDPSDEAKDRALSNAVRHALSKGITQVHAMGTWSDLATYRRAYEQDSLGVRIYAFVPISSWKRLNTLIDEDGWGNERLRWGGLKGFVDGSLGSTTAWFYDPYEDEPETSGLLVNDTTALRNWIMEGDGAGLQIAVHAIGDHANDWLLDVFEDAAVKNGVRDRRFRIEHAQHLSKTAISRFARQNVIPSMQPYHAIDDGRWAEKRIGPERIKTTYAFRSLLDAGARLTFGSDWTVAPLNPLTGIYAAVTRRTLDGANPDGWVPEQKVTVEEALTAYTVNNAYAGFQEEKIGKIKAGFLADFTVLSENLLTIDPIEIQNVIIVETWVNGQLKYKYMGK